MAKTYGLVNMVSSLGFARIWRKACVCTIKGEAAHVCDLMTGGGECLGHIKKHFGPATKVDLVDWSDVMCERARNNIARNKHADSEVLCCNALNLPRPENNYDVLYSTFGLKTLTDEELVMLANEIKRVLKPGGRFCMLEFSIPTNRALQPFFRCYVKYLVPLMGWLFLGNPDNYRMLWQYTVAFGNCDKVHKVLESCGLEVVSSSFFFGSATQIHGHKPLHGQKLSKLMPKDD
jgi:demethylmenaquinone methyltransferase/2-methoxy-6-polyprenyl-1,4-benzoquinol methylase